MKSCSKCKIGKELQSFNKRASSSDGYRGQCKECESITYKKYYNKNREKCLNKTKVYREANREICYERTRKWAENNVDKKNSIRAKRRASKLQATPKWLSSEHMSQIKDIYTEAQDLRWLNEEPLHVDHIVPLQGKNVCGMHVPWNLQILTASKNISKGNRFGTEPDENERQS